MRHAIIRFFFYYAFDYGFGGHPNDLESVDAALAIEHGEPGCWSVRLERVVGYAHGIDWYRNELEIAPDTKFPIAVLVEEGKHASCPDRNADGTYTPGYDVNRRVHDAWGVRDVLGSGYLFGGAYIASMSKLRRLEDRVVPSVARPMCVGPQRASVRPGTPMRARYELRPAGALTLCPEAPSPALLHEMMQDNRFGAGHLVEQASNALVEGIYAPLSGTSGWLTNLSLRFDRSLGLSVLSHGADLGETYLVPRLTWIPGSALSFEGLFTSTGSQYVSRYFSLGISYEERRLRSLTAASTALDERAWSPVMEGGWKFRFPLSGRLRWAALGYHFAGLRIGLWNTGFAELETLRFILELGAGAY